MDTLKALLEQEHRLIFTDFDEDTALQLGLWVVEHAKKHALPVVVDIRRGEQQLFHASRPGTTVDNDGWVTRKTRLVNKFAHSSFYLGQLLKHEGLSMEEKWQLSSMEYAPFGGCFPIVVKNEGMVGTIAISGLPQEEDHALAVQALEAHLNAQA